MPEGNRCRLAGVKTTMTWHFQDFNCQDNLASNPDCTRNIVKFEITVS